MADQLDNAELQALADSRLSYEYPYKSGAEVKPKYSVTELNRRAVQGAGAGEAITVSAFDPDAAKRGGGRGAAAAGGALTAAERGTLMHLLMEKADFAEAVAFTGGARAYLQTVADRLLADEILTAEEYDSLSIDKAAAFFSDAVGQRAAAAAKAGKLRKEKEFIYSMDMSELSGEGAGGAEGAEGESTIVQGVIDCFFEEEDGIVLIDYKNSYMGAGRKEDDIRQTYAGQIDLYHQALEGATGKQVKEAYLFLFDTGSFVRM